jgi:hypothetical protein
MNSKKKTTIFLILTIVIWGIVIWRFFDLQNTQGSVPTIGLKEYTKKTKKSSKTYEYSFNYSNPFDLSSDRKRKKANQENKEKKIPVQKQIVHTPVKVQPVFPDIKYLGNMESNQNKTTYLIDLDGDIISLSGPDSIDNCFVKHLYADSIILSLDDRQKTIKKQ